MTPTPRRSPGGSENLPGIEFFINGDAPPLPLAEGSLDLVYAISIWSHFAPELGLRWFAEMHRLLRPGGHLLSPPTASPPWRTTRCLSLRTPEQSGEIADALYSQGWWYAPEFGEEGDWGVVNPDWGTAFLTPEWLLAKLCPQLARPGIRARAQPGQPGRFCAAAGVSGRRGAATRGQGQACTPLRRIYPASSSERRTSPILRNRRRGFSSTSMNPRLR